MKKTYRAVKYMRTSCPEFETEYRDSIENQRRMIDAFLKQNQDITVISERVDDGFSGLFFERPAFNSMLTEIESNQVDCVIVKDLSRLGRDYIEVGRLLRDFFPAHHVRLISLDDRIDSIQLEGFDRIFAILKNIFSEQYCQDISVKTRTALEAKCRQGCYIGAIPMYGYQRSEENRHRLEPDVYAARVVKEIFEMKLHGLSTAKIANKLNADNIPSPLAYKRKHGVSCPTGGFSDKRNPLWSATTILRILKDETYTGTLAQRKQQRPSYKVVAPILLNESKWIRAEHTHEAIVSRQDYDVVQRLLQLDTRSAPNSDEIHIFSGMLICGNCGRKITRKTVKHQARNYIYYCCSMKKSNGCGFSGMMEDKFLYELVHTKLVQHIACAEKLHLNLSCNQVLIIRRADLILKTTKIEQKISQLNLYRQNLPEALLSRVIQETEFYHLQFYYGNEIYQLEKEVAVLYEKLRAINENCCDNTGCIQELLRFKGLKTLTREAVVKTINSITVISKTEIEICFRYQTELSMLVRYDEKGGAGNGKEKQKRK